MRAKDVYAAANMKWLSSEILLNSRLPLLAAACYLLACSSPGTAMPDDTDCARCTDASGFGHSNTVRDAEAGAPDAADCARCVDASGSDSGAGPDTVLDSGTDAEPNDCPVPSADTVSLASLLHEQTTLDWLTRLAEPNYTSQLASSFNPASVDAKPDEPAWFANRDSAAFQPGVPLVLLDTDGPGALTRIWSANPSGTLRIYLDGNAEPALEAPMKELLSGNLEPIGAPFGFIAAGGYNLYFPIPFNEHCRVTVTSDAERIYYQLDHRRYEEGTRVATFSEDELAAASCELDLASQRLTEPAQVQVASNAQRSTFSLISQQTMTSHVIDADTGGSTVRELRVAVSTDDPDTLRETLLSIRFDGVESVRAPLGDFFGTSPGLATVASLPITVVPESRELVARWPMPFANTLEIALLATSDRTLNARFEVTTEPRAWDDKSLLFYAQWHSPEWLVSEPARDWTMMSIEGTGHYVGNTLHVLNAATGWWGEGDEKVFVDGEGFPSHFGTGTEDYYGYAWCSNQLFSTPFIGQTEAGTRHNFGVMSLYRFHMLDDIPFNKSLRFDLEIDHWSKTAQPLGYDAVMYFYARPGARVSPEAPEPTLYRLLRSPVPEPTDVAEGPYACGKG